MRFCVASVFLTMLIVGSSAQNPNINANLVVMVDDDVSARAKASVSIARGSTLYDLMSVAEWYDEFFSFLSDEDGELISVGGYYRNILNNKRWLIFSTDYVTSKRFPPKSVHRVFDGIYNLIIRDRRTYTVWLRTDNM